QKSQRWQKVAAKLEKSQTRFRELFEASADAAIILDDGLIVDCNRAAVEMMGYTDKNRLLSLNPAQISPEFQPDGQASAEKAGTMITLAMTHGSHRFEWVCQRFNGENFWVEVVLTLMPEKDRLVFHAIWRDISDRKVAEAALLKSEAKMRQLIERTADAILLLDAETLVFTEANQAAADLMGFKDPSQIIGLSPLDFSPEIQPDGIPSREKIQISQEPLLAQGNARFEWLCNRQNGEQIWLEVILTLMTTEEKPSLHCVWRDIHDRKMAEAASQRYQERLRFLVEQTPIAIIEWDANAKVVGWNPAAETIFGYSASEMLDQDLRKVVPELDRALVAKVIQSLFEQRGGSYSVNQNLCKDGSLITCEWINTPLRDAEDNVIGVFSMAQNITDRENAKAEILQKSQELEQTLQELQHTQLQMVQGEKMASLGNLVAGVAHEINNPIGFLNGSIKNTKDYIQDLFDYLDVYQQHQPPTAPVQDSAEDIELEFILEDLPNMLNSMQGATDRIKAISNSLRTFSRADTENKVKADLHEGLDSTLLILKYRLKANEQRPAIEVIKNYGELPDIDCFPGQLNQVFMNLLANAIDAFDEANQGKSFAEIKAAPNQITLCTKVIENQVEIQIQDNGCGMKPEIQARIFEQGFTTKAVGEGTGLGMAIARQIIMEKHSGSLECSSELGQGTTFIIILPC
ncbi:MAG: PAS domain-containing sensor histidine kinase, partial [Spirulinaceae cyanobacterium]